MELINESVCDRLNGQAGRVYEVREKEWALGDRMIFSGFGVPGGSVLWNAFSAVNVSPFYLQSQTFSTSNY